MSNIQAYQSLKPCITPGTHKFTANYVGVIVCERCGMTPAEARLGSKS